MYSLIPKSKQWDCVYLSSERGSDCPVLIMLFSPGLFLNRTLFHVVHHGTYCHGYLPACLSRVSTVLWANNRVWSVPLCLFCSLLDVFITLQLNGVLSESMSVPVEYTCAAAQMLHSTSMLNISVWNRAGRSLYCSCV